MRVDPGFGASAVAFEVDLGLQGSIDRFDYLTEWFQVTLVSPGESVSSSGQRHRRSCRDRAPIARTLNRRVPSSVALFATKPNRRTADRHSGRSRCPSQTP